MTGIAWANDLPAVHPVLVHRGSKHAKDTRTRKTGSSNEPPSLTGTNSSPTRNTNEGPTTNDQRPFNLKSNNANQKLESNATQLRKTNGTTKQKLLSPHAKISGPNDKNLGCDFVNGLFSTQVLGGSLATLLRAVL